MGASYASVSASATKPEAGSHTRARIVSAFTAASPANRNSRPGSGRELGGFDLSNGARDHLAEALALFLGNGPVVDSRNFSVSRRVSCAVRHPRCQARISFVTSHSILHVRGGSLTLRAPAKSKDLVKSSNRRIPPTQLLSCC
jgi:hypothetical protein